MPLRAIARVNLSAIERNAARLQAGLAAGAELCAVVKADGYGHGAVPAARAALAGGAGSLAVATADEAAELRAGGIEAPVLVMGAISRRSCRWRWRPARELVAWDQQFVDEVARAAGAGGRSACTSSSTAGWAGWARATPTRRWRSQSGSRRRGPALELAGAMTHFATADDDPEFMREQLEAFGAFVARLRRDRRRLVVHAANSAATLRGRPRPTSGWFVAGSRSTAATR